MPTILPLTSRLLGAVRRSCAGLLALLAIHLPVHAGEPRIPSGLCVVVPATTAADLIARAQDGRVLVHGLVVDPAQATALRAEIAKAGATGLVSVMVWNGFPALPYAEELVNQLVVDRDALATAPSDAEIDRVVIPQWGFAEVRSQGAWRRRNRPLPKTYGEWTHYYHDATNNPVGREAAGIATGIRWITGPLADGDNHSYAGNGTLVDVAAPRRMVTATTITARHAFNGLPIWRQAYGDMKRFSARRYDANVIAGDRFIRLRTSDGPLVALSLATGKEEVVYDAMPITRPKDGQSVFVAATAAGGVTAMAIVHEGVLYAASGDACGALDVATGKLKWLWKSPEGGFIGYPCIDIRTGTLALATGERATGSSRITAFTGTRIVGLDSATGAVRWSIANPIKDHLALMSTYDGGVYLQTAAHLGTDAVSLLALDAATGKVRWQQMDRDMPGVGTMLIYPDRLYVVRSSLHIFDLASGDPLGSWSVGNSRCDVPRGGATFINNFGHFFDVTGKDRVVWDRREITRNSCGGASLPFYGLRYSTDNRCSCYEAVRGRVAQGATPVPPPTPDAQRLTKGPAYGRPLGKDASGWIALLGDDRRLGAGGPLKRPVPEKRWQVRIAAPSDQGPIPAEWRDGDNWNGPITPPTVADGRIYVAETVGHRLHCLSADDGRILWSFAVDARIDGPPRIAKGRLVFGSRDGHVYCLDAADGALVWRFQAARAHRLIVAYGQLESAWPLRGALPVIDDTVIAPAGYHPEADGGILVWGLDLATGQARWQRTLGQERPTITLDTRPDGKTPRVPGDRFGAIFEPNRTVNLEIIAHGGIFRLGSTAMKAADGSVVDKDHQALHLLPRWGAFAPPHRRATDMNPRGPGGYGPVWGQIGSKLFSYRDGTRAGKPGVPGRPLCMDDRRIVIQKTSLMLGDLVCYPRSAAADGGKPLWTVTDNLRGGKGEVAPSSMAIAGEAVVMAGTRLSKDSRAPTTGPFEVRSLEDGRLLHREELPSGTVDHGLAVADGRLYLSLMDGSVLCME